MVYNTQNTKFASVNELYHVTPDAAKLAFRQWSAEKERLADTADRYGGRRLLGVTDKNNPIWLSFTIDRETLNISMKLSHDISTIRKSKLCPRRIDLGTNEPLHNLDHAMRPAGKTDHGEVTQRTLDYIETVMTMVDSGSIGKVKGKCTKSLFMIVSNLVYPGSAEYGKFRWRDVMSTWDIPKGEYLVVNG